MTDHFVKAVGVATLVAFMLTLGAVATPARAVAAPNSERACQGDTPSAAPKSYQPVLLVHGWTGERLTDLEQALTSVKHIKTYQFDYSEYHDYWANDRRIAPCLAHYVHEVSKANGGRPVIIVAHSMGGLATRYAFMARYAERPLTSALVPKLITLGTPYKGSPLGGRGLAQLMDDDTRDGPNGGLCLAFHEGAEQLDEQCGELPGWLPAGIELTTIGGDITVDRTVFGVRLYSLGLRGDGIVPIESANGYAESGPTEKMPADQASVRGAYSNPCRVTSDDVLKDANVVLRGFAGTGLTFFAIVSGMDLATAIDYSSGRPSQSHLLTGFQLAAAQAAECGHTGIRTFGPAVGQVKEALDAAVAELNPTKVTEEVVLRPFTAEGVSLAPGWTVLPEYGSELVNCSALSLHTVNPGVADCSPVDVAGNCWNYMQLTVACLVNPFERTLRLYTAQPGALPNPFGPGPHRRHPWPLAVEMDGGMRCTFTREFIDWNGPSGEDGWGVLYPCDTGSDGRRVAIYAPGGSASLNGEFTDLFTIDRPLWNDERWFVRVAEPGGALQSREVDRAYFLGE